jgi:hypothetical protein
MCEFESETTLLRSPSQASLRANIRNFLLCATPAEVRREIVLSIDRDDAFRAACCLEVLLEELPERTGTTLHEFVKQHDVSLIGGQHCVTVCCQHPELGNLTDFVVILANSQGTKLMSVPGIQTAACGACGFVGCRSGCSEFEK